MGAVVVRTKNKHIDNSLFLIIKYISLFQSSTSNFFAHSSTTAATTAATAATATTSTQAASNSSAAKRLGAVRRRGPRQKRQVAAQRQVAASLFPPAARAAIAAAANGNGAPESEALLGDGGALVAVAPSAEEAEMVLAERLTPVILALADDPLVVAAVAQSPAVQQFLHTESDLVLAGADLRLFDTSTRAIAAGEFVEFAPELDSSAAAPAAAAPAAAPEAPRLSPFHAFLEQRRDLLLKVVLPTAIAVIVARAVPSVAHARELVSSVFRLAVGRWFHTAAAATARMASEATTSATA
jgi:hypothetical protein